MSYHGRTRREALRDIVATVAAAAGLSALEVDALLAEVKKVHDLSKLNSIKASDDAVKALKVLLAPKAQAAQVFQSEFGKAPALSATIDAQTRKPVCPAYLAPGGACSGLDCGVVVCNGLGCSNLGRLELDSKRQVAARQPAKVDPSIKLGSEGSGCGCRTQCLNVGGCTCHPRWFNVPLGDLQAQFLRENQSDPYILALMKEYEVATPEALEKELVQVLAQRRMGM